MVQRVLRSANWYRAITLRERIATLRASERYFDNARVDDELAKRRLDHWRSQKPFTNDERFNQRLAVDMISEDDFRRLLGEAAESICSRFDSPPEWFAKFKAAFSEPSLLAPLPDPQGMETEQSAAFLEIVYPLINRGRARLREGIHEILKSRTNLPVDSSTIEELFYANLPGRLLMLLSRTLVLELNVARLEGVLDGDTAEERFSSFVRRLRRPGAALAFFEQYPVLARQLVICVDQWVNTSLTFFEHFGEDWQTIRRTFHIDDADAGVLVEVRGGAGDLHRDGRSVLLLRFSSGLRLVYKPRSLAVELHFQELLRWINERGAHLPFRTLNVLDGGDHGWVEFVPAAGCTTAEEVEQFYQRIGGYLALLYILEATDFHSENLVAAGEHPVLLDLETIFGPQVEREPVNADAGQLAIESTQESVLRIMLLPRRFLQNPENPGVDISGLANKGGQLTPFGVPAWEAGSTDEMRLVRKRLPMHDDGNTPTLNGARVDLLNYVDSIVSGFDCIYDIFQNHRNELLSDQSPLSRFADDEIRVILRSTHTYAALLRESCHPDLLQDALEKDRLLDRLWTHIDLLPYARRVIASEREDMHRGDVPMFTTTPSSLDLWSAPDNPISGVLTETGMTVVQRRIRRLGESDRAKQVWFIRASLATTDTGFGRVRRQIGDQFAAPPPATREALLEASRAVGDRLEALAIRGSDDASWIGLTFRNEKSASLMPLGADLYDGLPGVALFLAYLGAITEEQRYTDLAKAAVTSLRRETALSQAGKRPAIAHIGAFTGWGGLIYTLTHLGVLWGQSSLIDEAQSFVELIAPDIEETNELDIIDGLAGCIAGLLRLHRAAPSARTLAVAVACGDRLRAHIQSHDYEVLTGLSHGLAGMALALLDLAAVSGEERFRISALDLIATERQYFNPERGNWPDLRDRKELGETNNTAIYQVTWCHGAPGIGLARLRSLEYLDDLRIRDEIHTALATTLAGGFGGNHSLCHGDLGNLELLTETYRRLGDASWETEARRIAGFTLESIRRNGWISGVALGVENPGLMSGLAGIGYGLLRLAEPKRVPSVLTLE